MTVLEMPTPDPRTFDETSRPFAEAVAAQYAIKKMIGRGGMGIVYLARDRRLDRLVAIKTLPPHLAGDAAVRERFIRETRAAGGMSHPNIVPIHGADEVDGHVFFVMGFVDGDSLAARIAAHGRLDARTVIELLRDVGAALSHAHRRGIVHRDIKAENILIDRATGSAVVTDFGIARFAEAAPLTATGQLLGTVYYVSPEQVAGEAVDARSDLYSLGVVGYLASTGRFPFDGELASAVLVAHVTRPAAPVRAANPDVPPALAAIIDRCLAKKRDDRFANASELLAALESAERELETPQPSGIRPRLVSDTEAQAVWQRAADLQAMTGIHSRPAPVSRTRDAGIDRTRTSGFSVTEVRSAASEAGIPREYVEHALIERGLASPKSAEQHPLPRSAVRRSLWAGVPVDIVLDADVDGEVDQRRYDRLVNTLREGTATLGVSSVNGARRDWSTGWFGNRMHVGVWIENGRTRIRLTQSIRRSAITTLANALGAGAATGSLVALALDLVMRLPAPPWSITLLREQIAGLSAAAGVAISVVALRVGRAWVHRSREMSAARLQTLRDLLAIRAGDEEG